MDPSYLVDSDILIDHLRKRDEGLIKFLKQIEIQRIRAFISVVTEAEILSGKDAYIDRVKELLALFEKVNVTSAIAQLAGVIRRETKIEIPDALIAATAMSLSSTLVTRNRKDFERVKGLKIISSVAGKMIFTRPKK